MTASVNVRDSGAKAIRVRYIILFLLTVYTTTLPGRGIISASI